MGGKIQIMVTPNPRAYKFLVPIDLTEKGISFTLRIGESSKSPLFNSLSELNIFERIWAQEIVLTLTLKSGLEWNDEIQEKVLKILMDYLPHHQINQLVKEDIKVPLTGELKIIDAILDKHIRPSLLRDGGDIICLEYVDPYVFLQYQGACVSCPASFAGTLQAIQTLLSQEYKDHVIVKIKQADI